MAAGDPNEFSANQFCGNCGTGLIPGATVCESCGAAVPEAAGAELPSVDYIPYCRACGVPVAAYPEPGPLDVVGDTKAGCISSDLREACLAALTLERADALERSLAYSWEACADIFLSATEALQVQPELQLAG